MTWHATPDLLARYATEPELLDNATASSVEAHLLACEQCRRGVAEAVEPAWMAASWDAVVDRVDLPRSTVVERFLGWFFPGDMARVVAATPALRLSWLTAVVGMIAATVAVSRSADDLTPFLSIAPLVPIAGVAVSFGWAPDPAGEAAVATPMHGAGLVLRRSVVVLATSLVVLLAGTAALPELEWRAAGWLLPAIALCAAALALSTWLPPLTATVAAAIGWEVIVVGTGLIDKTTRGIADGPLFSPTGQLGCALLIPIALAVVGLRHVQFETMEAR